MRTMVKSFQMSTTHEGLREFMVAIPSVSVAALAAFGALAREYGVPVATGVRWEVIGIEPNCRWYERMVF